MRTKWGLLSATALYGALLSTAALAQAPIAPQQAGQDATAENGEAQDTATVQDIVVTANRRAEAAQTVPISMSVFSDDFIKQHFTDPFDVAKFTPNYQANSGHGPTAASVSIRGIGNVGLGAEPNASRNVLTYYDGLVADKGIIASIAPWDLQRIEVQRGPQGTLYGRNAVGGLVQYISASPTEDFSGYAQVTVGEFDLRRFEGAVGGAIAKGVRIRLSGMIHDRGGDINNTFFNIKQGGQNWWGLRGIVDWDISDATTLRLKGQHFERRVTDLAFNAAPGALLPDTTRAWLAASGADPDLSRLSNYTKTQAGLRDPFAADKNDLVEVTLNHDFGPVALTAIGGYINASMNWDNLPADYPVLLYHQRVFVDLKQWSGELRLTSKTDSRFQWIAGGFYLHSSDRRNEASDQTSFVRDLDGDGKTRYNGDSPEDQFDGILPVIPGAATYAEILQTGSKSETYAGFVHTTFNWTDRLKTTHALRYTYEGVNAAQSRIAHFDFPVSPGVVPGTLAQIDDFYRFIALSPANQRATAVRTFNDTIIPAASKSWKRLTWRLGVDYDLTRSALLYASVSRGFKGGYLTPTDSADPETVTVYELGAKTDWFNRRLRVNGSVFYTDYKGYQLPLFVLQSNGSFTFEIDNLPKSRIYGAELEITAIPVENLIISMNAGVLNTKITKVTPGNEALLGNRIPFSEKVNFSGLVRYDLKTDAGTFSPEVSWRYRGKFWSLKENNDVIGQQGDFWTVDLRLGFESANKRFYGAAYVKNLFNEVKPVLVTTNPSAFSVFATTLSYVNERRNWGATVGVRF